MEWISSNGIRYDTRLGCGERAKQGHGDRHSDAEFRTPSPVNWVMEEIFCGKVFLLCPTAGPEPPLIEPELISHYTHQFM
jgi:hypothetical protein